MSDLHKRNTEAMVSAAKRFQQDVADLKTMIVSLNAKVTTLTDEVASLKRQQIMDAVQRQIDETGHGGTA